MGQPDINDAVLTRHFDLRGGDGVDIHIWKPEPIDDGGSYMCQYLISGLGEARLRQGYGVDKVQALMLTLQIIGGRLYASPEYEDGRLTYLGSRDLDLPLLPGEKAGADVYETAALLTLVGYPTVVVMPDQKFPYIAWPGDYVNRLISRLAELSRRMEENAAEARTGLEQVSDALRKEQGYYEAVCKRAGYHPSYLTVDQLDSDGQGSER